VHRVCNRLGRVKTSDPLKTSALIEKVIPGDLHNLAHHSLILFGRYFCTARPLQQQCKRFKAQKKSSAK
jgi:endonuclease III